MALSSLIKRSATGIIYVACIVSSLLFFNGWPFIALCMLFCVLAMLELRHLMPVREKQGHTLIAAIDIVAGLALLSLVPMTLFSLVSGGMILGALVVGVALVSLLILRLVAQLYIHSSNAVNDLASSMLGFMYIAVPLTIATLVYSIWGAPIVLAMFIMIWLNDTGAFCVGSMIGRRRLFERISPKKSWEGFWGGMVFCVASAFVIKYCFGSYSTSLSIWQLCGMGVIVSVISTWGDLVESLIKRTVGVKDSGHLLPGHGGILDRIDSLLLTAPALFAYLGILLILNYIA